MYEYARDYLIVDHYERKTYALILQLPSSSLVRHEIAVTYFPSPICVCEYDYELSKHGISIW